VHGGSVRCRAAACGDGIVAGTEQCEDGDAPPQPEDGCDSACQLEPGYACNTPGQACRATRCGDGVPEGTEQCDDGNNDWGDGCTPSCTREPSCTNGTCTALCGDGVILPGTNEECDDGNLRDNDGCSSSCRFEAGFQCNTVTEQPPATVSIPVVFRDFRGYDLTDPQGHIDFQNGNGAEQGIVQAQLGSDGKPVYAKETTGSGSATTHGAAAFDQWYRDVPAVNRTIVSELVLRQGTGGTYVFENTAFFPLDNLGWVAEGKEQHRTANDDKLHNFHFTSETRYWFQYKGTEVLAFYGDDDVWVFINGHLAVDIGGVHGPENGSVRLSDRAAAFGLDQGGIYEAVVFQAERRTSGSQYKLTLTNFLSSRTTCESTCGDAVVQASEECDDGVNAGGYGQCARGCVWGPRCGDGIVQSDQGEVCDDGNTVSGDSCPANCKLIFE
jgi:fibro-slime domain-containing protein